MNFGFIIEAASHSANMPDEKAYTETIIVGC